MKELLSKMAKSTPAGLVSAICGATATVMVANVARIGFGGNTGSFLIGFAAAIVVAAIIATLRYATSKKSSDNVGFALGLVILVVGAVLVVLAAFQRNWDWAQFGYGIVVMALLVVAIASPCVFKFGWLRKQSTEPASTTTETTPLRAAPEAAVS